VPKFLQTPGFTRAVKRLHKNQKSALDQAVRDIAADPARGEAKAGDLAGVRVYKFRLDDNLALLAYEFFAAADIVKLLALGSHENFYRDLKH
jgi:mRNA-degrading endonuclease YafQ of YafQ-DinJ toxin-antitoxin module